MNIVYRSRDMHSYDDNPDNLVLTLITHSIGTVSHRRNLNHAYKDRNRDTNGVPLRNNNNSKNRSRDPSAVSSVAYNNNNNSGKKLQKKQDLRDRDRERGRERLFKRRGTAPGGDNNVNNSNTSGAEGGNNYVKSSNNMLLSPGRQPITRDVSHGGVYNSPNNNPNNPHARNHREHHPSQVDDYLDDDETTSSQLTQSSRDHSEYSGSADSSDAHGGRGNRNYTNFHGESEGSQAVVKITSPLRHNHLDSPPSRKKRSLPIYPGALGNSPNNPNNPNLSSVTNSTRSPSGNTGNVNVGGNVDSGLSKVYRTYEHINEITNSTLNSKNPISPNSRNITATGTASGTTGFGSRQHNINVSAEFEKCKRCDTPLLNHQLFCTSCGKRVGQ